MPDFTAIIPLHNKAQTIERSLRSITAQTLAPTEIVIVDDVSTDGSPDIAQSLGLPNLKLVHRDTPGPGGYPARNLGVETAQTEWVGFLDADDEWLPDHLEAAAEIIAKNPEVNTIFSGRRIQRDGKGTREIVVPEARVYSFGELLDIFADRNVFHVNSLIIRRETFLKTGGFRTDRGWKRGGDSELFLRLTRDGAPVYMTPRITTLYDMNFSDVVTNTKNYQGEHPTHRTLREMMVENPEEALRLKRVANAKVVEWIRQMPNSILRQKLGMLSQSYPLLMPLGGWARILRSFAGHRPK